MSFAFAPGFVNNFCRGISTMESPVAASLITLMSPDPKPATSWRTLSPWILMVMLIRLLPPPKSACSCITRSARAPAAVEIRAIKITSRFTIK